MGTALPFPILHDCRDPEYRDVIIDTTELRCRSGFATPTETFESLNNFQNESNGIVNPVTPQKCPPLIYVKVGTTITSTLIFLLI